MPTTLYRVLIEDLGVPLYPLSAEEFREAWQAEHGWAPVLVPVGEGYSVRAYPLRRRALRRKGWVFEGEPKWRREDWIAAGAYYLRILEPAG